MINVLIVEDSPSVQAFLTEILRADSELHVVGIAHDGVQAVEAVRRTNPDVITMDIHMPRMNGFDATRKIMETKPTPIVIVSGSTTREEIATTFDAIEAGALAVVARPRGGGHPEYEATARELVQTIKAMSEVRVVRRWPKAQKEPAAASLPRIDLQKAPVGISMVAIGASTGGPIALERVLSGLPKEFPVPILIVQHMTSGFTNGFAEWLGRSSGLPVRVPVDGEFSRAGHVYIAPDELHLGIRPGGRIMLSKDEAENGLRPSVSYLFRSAAKYYGGHVIGVLLSGMGRDGAEELKMLRDRGATTIVQDEASSVVFGMPGEAVKLGAAMYVLSPERIKDALVSLMKMRTSFEAHIES